jgi:hypothetical protein
MNDEAPEPGTRRLVGNEWRVYYDGYWVRAYEVPADTLLAKKQLITALTRRLFNHVEHGLNIPGTRLEEARIAYDRETDADRKRVKGAMLAGCLFNRATDVFTKLVELQAVGVRIDADNALMCQCGDHLQEALVLGKMVFHRSGEEGIDELWGEPFKAFAFPIEDFYRSRYLKIAATMKLIDRLRTEISATFEPLPMFQEVIPTLHAFCEVAKCKTQTLRTDSDIFDVWSSMVVAGEVLARFRPRLSQVPGNREIEIASHGARLLTQGKDIIFDIARARVPMPKTATEFLERLERFRGMCVPLTSAVPQSSEPRAAS